MTDIVMMTCDRLALFKRSVARVLKCTRSPFNFYVIDDASTEGNTEYTKELMQDGKVAGAIFHEDRRGIPTNINQILDLATSDPVYLMGDDALVPQLEPDWISQALAIWEKYPELGMLGLNTPMSTIRNAVHKIKSDGVITTCGLLGGNLFIRRAMLERFRIPEGTKSPVKWLTRRARDAGFEVAFINEIYARHIGLHSVRTGADLTYLSDQVGEVDPLTLKPLRIEEV